MGTVERAEVDDMTALGLLVRELLVPLEDLSGVERLANVRNSALIIK